MTGCHTHTERGFMISRVFFLDRKIEQKKDRKKEPETLEEIN